MFSFPDDSPPQLDSKTDNVENDWNINSSWDCDEWTSTNLSDEEKEDSCLEDLLTLRDMHLTSSSTKHKKKNLNNNDKIILNTKSNTGTL